MELKSSESKDKFVNVCCSSPTEVFTVDAAEVDNTYNKRKSDNALEYGIEDTPAFYLCMLFGLQVIRNLSFCVIYCYNYVNFIYVIFPFCRYNVPDFQPVYRTFNLD